MVTQSAAGPQTTSTFRLLLWLKWTLMWRGIRRDKMRLVGLVLMLIFFVPLSLGIAFFCWSICSNHPALIPYVFLMALGLAYFVWLVTPLLGFPLNESYDPTRLFVYPVSYQKIFLAAVVAGCFDIPTLLVLPIFLALIIAAASSFLAGIASLLLVALFLLQTIATAQAVMLALIGFLRSRRFRDITMVLLPLFGMAFYIAQQTAIHRMDLLMSGLRNIMESPVWQYLHWLPPGWAQSGVMAAREGNYGMVLVYLALLAAVCAVMASAAGYAMRQLYLGERGPVVKSPLIDSSPSPASRPPSRPSGTLPPITGEGTAAVPAASTPPPRSWGEDGEARRGAGAVLPPALNAMMEKEWRYLWRDPQYKAAAVQIVSTLAIFAVMIYINPAFKFLAGPQGPFAGHTDDSFSPFLRGLMSFRIVGILLFASVTFLFNIFGGEGSAVTVLFSFPTPRRDILLGKNITHGAVLLVVCVVGELLGSYLLKSMSLAPVGIMEAVVSLPIMMAAGNLISIRFPHRMVVRGQRWGRSDQVSLGSSGAGTGAGCGYAFVYLSCYLATFVTLLPALFCVVWPVILDASALWRILGLVVAVAYSALIYFAGLYIASNWMSLREMAIIERLAPSEM